MRPGRHAVRNGMKLARGLMAWAEHFNRPADIVDSSSRDCVHARGKCRSVATLNIEEALAFGFGMSLGHFLCMRWRRRLFKGYPMMTVLIRFRAKYSPGGSNWGPLCMGIMLPGTTTTGTTPEPRLISTSLQATGPRRTVFLSRCSDLNVALYPLDNSVLEVVPTRPFIAQSFRFRVSCVEPARLSRRHWPSRRRIQCRLCECDDPYPCCRDCACRSLRHGG